MENRNDNGTFAPAEPLTGQAGVEADQGFRQMPETAPKDEPRASDIETEAANLAISRVFSEEPKPEDEQLGYFKPDGSPVDAAETIPLKRAASDLSSYHEGKADQAIQTASSDLAKQVDALRAEALKANPELASHYGLDGADVLARAEAEKASVERAAATAQEEETYTPTPGLDPEVERALKHPQVREAIERELTEANSVRENYRAALDQANTFARAAFLETVPELSVAATGTDRGWTPSALAAKSSAVQCRDGDVTACQSDPE
jgi:hypothetical protein